MSEYGSDGAITGAVAGWASAGFSDRLKTRNLDEYSADRGIVAKVRKSLTRMGASWNRAVAELEAELMDRARPGGTE